MKQGSQSQRQWDQPLSVRKTYALRAMLKSILARLEIGVTFPVLVEGDKAVCS